MFGANSHCISDTTQCHNNPSKLKTRLLPKANVRANALIAALFCDFAVSSSPRKRWTHNMFIYLYIYLCEMLYLFK